MSNNNKEKVTILSNIISLNPTGTLDYNGTFGLSGGNRIVSSPDVASKENLEKTMNNEIICDVEKFENYYDYQNNLNYLNSNDNIKINLKKYIIMIFIFILLLILVYLI